MAAQVRAAGLPAGGGDRGFPAIAMPPPPQPPGAVAMMNAPQAPAVAPLRQQQLMQLEQQRQAQLARPAAVDRRQLDPLELAETGVLRGNEPGTTTQMMMRAASKSQADIVSGLETRVARMEAVIRGLTSELNKANGVRSEMESTITRLMSAKQNSDARQAALAGELLALSKELQAARAESSASGRELRVAVSRVEGKLGAEAKLVEQLQEADTETVNSAAKQFVSLRATLNEIQAERRQDQQAMEAAISRMEERARVVEVKAVQRAASVTESRIGAIAKTITQMEERQVAREVSLAERLRDEVGVFRKHEASDKKVAVERLIVMEGAIKEEHENRMKAQTTLKRGIEAVASQCTESIKKLKAEGEARNKRLAAQMKQALEKMHGLMRDAEVGLRQDRKALESVLKMEISARLKAVDEVRDEMVMSSQRTQSFCAGQVKQVAANSALLSEKVGLLLSAQRKLFHRQATTDHNIRAVRDDISGMVVDSVLDREVANAVDERVDDSLRTLGAGVDSSMEAISTTNERFEAEVQALTKEASRIREELDAEEEERKQAHDVVLGVIESMDVRLMTAVQQETTDRAEALEREMEARGKDVDGMTQALDEEASQRQHAFETLINRVRAEADCRARAVQSINEDASALNQKVDNAAADSTLFEELLRTEIDAVSKSGAAALVNAEMRMTTRVKDVSTDARDAIERAKEETDSRIRSAVNTEIESRRNAIASVRAQVETIRAMASEAVKVADIAADTTLQEKELREALEAEMHTLEDEVTKSVVELRNSIARNLVKSTRADENIKREAKRSIDAVEHKMVDGFTRAADDLDDAAVSAKLDTELLRTDVMETLDSSIDEAKTTMSKEVDGLRRSLTSKLEKSVAASAAGQASIERALTQKVADAETRASLEQRAISDKVDRTVENFDSEIKDLQVSSKLDLEVVRTEVLDALDGAVATSVTALDERVDSLRTDVTGSIGRIDDKVETSRAESAAARAELYTKIESTASAVRQDLSTQIDAAACHATLQMQENVERQNVTTKALRDEMEHKIHETMAQSAEAHQTIEQKIASDVRRINDSVEEATVSSKLDLELLRTELESGMDTLNAETKATCATSISELRMDVTQKLQDADAKTAAIRTENDARNGEVLATMTAGIDTLRRTLTSTLDDAKVGLERDITSTAGALREELASRVDESSADATKKHAELDALVQSEVTSLRDAIANVSTKIDTTAASEAERIDTIVQRIDNNAEAASNAFETKMQLEFERVDNEMQRVDADVSKFASEATQRTLAEATRLDASIAKLEAETAEKIRAESNRLDAHVASVATDCANAVQAEAERVNKEVTRLNDALDESVVHTKLDLELLRTDAMFAVDSAGDHAATNLDTAIESIRGDFVQRLDESSTQTLTRASELDEKLNAAVGQMTDNIGKTSAELHERISGEAERVEEEFRRLDAQVERVDYEVDQRILGEAQRVDAEFILVRSAVEGIDTALNEKVSSESKRTNAELQRIEADVSRSLSEGTERAQAEAERVNAALTKVAEDAERRVQSEVDRIDADIVKCTSEVTERAHAETERVDMELQRMNTHVAKLEAETADKMEKETERVDAEVQRVDAGVSALKEDTEVKMHVESERVNAEVGRVNDAVEQSIVHAKVDLEVLRTEVMHAVECASAQAATKIDAEVFAVRQDMSGKVKESESTAEAQQASIAARLAAFEVKSTEAIGNVRSDLMGAVTDRSSALERSMQSTEANLATEMNKLREHVTKEVNDTAASLDGKLTTSNEQTEKKLADLRDHMSVTVAAAVDESGSRTAAAHAALEDQVKDHVARIETEIERTAQDVAERVDNEVKRIEDDVVEKFQDEVTRVDGEFARLDARAAQIEADARTAIEQESVRTDTEVRRVQSEVVEHIQGELSRVDGDTHRLDTKLSEEVTRIDAAIESTAAAQESSNAEAITSLGAEMSNLQSSMESRLDETNAFVKTQATEHASRLEAMDVKHAETVDALRTELVSSVEDTKTRLSETIDTVAADVSAKLEESNAHNGARLADLDAKTRDGITNLETAIESTAEESRSQLENTTAVLKEQIDTDVNAAKQEMATAMTQLRDSTMSTLGGSSDRIEDIEAALASDIAQVREDVLGAVGEAKDECNANVEDAKKALASDIEATRSTVASELRTAEAQLSQAVEGLRADTADNAAKFKEHVENKFDRVENKTEHVENKFEHIENKFDRVEVKFEHVEAKFEHVEARFEESHAKAEEINRESLQVVMDRFDKNDAKMAEDIAKAQASIREVIDERANRAATELTDSMKALRDDFAERLDGGTQNGETRHAAYLAKFEALETKAVDDLAVARTEMVATFDERLTAALADATAAVDAVRADLSHMVEETGTQAGALQAESEAKIQEIRDSLSSSVAALDEGIQSKLETAMTQAKDGLTSDVNALREEIGALAARDEARSADLESALESVKEDTAQSVQNLSSHIDSKSSELDEKMRGEIERLEKNVQSIESQRNVEATSEHADEKDVATVKSAVDELKAELEKSVTAQQQMKTEFDATLQSTHEMIEDEASIRSVAMEELRNEEMNHYKELMDHTTSRLAEEVENIEESLNNHGDEMSGQQQNIGKLEASLNAIEKSLEAEREERNKALADENADRVDATQALEELMRNDAQKLEKELKDEITSRIAAIGAQIKTESAQRETKMSEIETKTMEDYSNLQSKIESLEEAMKRQA